MTMIQRKSPVPRYYQLKELIREKIAAGAWKPGEAIPSERELCEQYGISRMTARQSITELVHEGVLYREQGRGTFVGQARITQQLMRLTGFTADIRSRGQQPSTRVLSAEMWSCDEIVAERLRVKPGQPVFRLRRLRLADADPLAIETSVVCFIGCEQLLHEDFAHQSLYALLETHYGLPPVEAEQVLEAGLATAEEASALGIPISASVLHTRRTTYTERSQPIEYATSTYRGDKYAFYTRLAREQPYLGGP